MKLSPFIINQYPLKKELRIGDATITQRKSITMSGVADDGTPFSAEFAPLPGLHKAGINLIKEELQKYLAKFHSLDQHVSLSQESNMLLELAQLDWLKKRSPFHFFKKFKIVSGQKELLVPINKLAFTSDDIQQYIAVKRLKVKIGRSSMEQEISWILALIKINPAILLRLDGNRQLTREQLQTFHQQLPPENIEYWEEPLSDPQQMYSLDREMPLALDETLEIFMREKNFPPGVTTWVIKPSLIGGIEKAIKFIHLAQYLGFNVIISSTFDPPSYLYYCGLLSNLLARDKEISMGLDTLKFFANPAPNPWVCERGQALKINLF